MDWLKVAEWPRRRHVLLFLAAFGLLLLVTLCGC